MIKQLFILLLLITFGYSNINFTKEELKWIKDNPVVKVGGEMDWAPFDFVNNSSKYDGITKDYLDLISKKSGLQFEVITGYNWSELVTNFQNKQFDILPAIYYAKDREGFGNYTTSYYTVRDYLFVKSDSNIDSIEDLEGKVLAIPKGYSIIPKIKKKYPEIKILETRSIVDSIASVLSNQADATLEVHAVMTYTIKSNAIEGLKIVAQEGLGTNPLHMLVQKDKEILLSILNKSIIDVNKDEQKEIAKKWLDELVKDQLLDKKQTLWLFVFFAFVVILLLLKQYLQKQINVKLEEQRKELETIFHTTKDGIAILDLETNFLHFNDAYLNMTGFTKAELLSKSCISLGISEDQEKSKKALQEVLEKGFIENFEKTCIVKDGKRLLVNMSVALMPDKQRLLVSAKDVTKTKENEKLLKEYVKMVDEHVIISSTDIDGNITNASAAFCKMMGFAKEDLIGKNHRIMRHPDMDNSVFKEMWETITQDKTWFGEIKNKKKPEGFYWAEMIVSPVFNEFSEKTGYTAIRQDVTDKKLLEISTKEQENTLRNLEKFIDAQDNIVTLTDGKEITFANKKLCEFLGYENLDAFKKEHQCICEFFIENDRFFHLGKIKEDENWLEVMLTLPHSQRIVSIMGSDFKIHAFSITINRFDENLLIVSLTDISQTMLEHIKLEEKTIHDKLTGAYNREFFEQNYERILYESINSGSKFAIALLDIDHFKIVNDTYGHDVGDETLIHFVKTIEKYSRKDDYLIRWGGEEFVMMLNVDSTDGLQKALDHLRKVIELQDFPKIGQKTCSIGGTLYENEEEIEVTLKRADEAVYEAKKSGRNKVVLHLIH